MRERKKLRRPGYDYTIPGAYFVTVCVHQRRKVLGRIVPNKREAVLRLTLAGQIVADRWEWLFAQYPYLRRDAYVVMPNHFHGIIWIDPDGMAPPLPDPIAAPDFGAPPSPDPIAAPSPDPAAPPSPDPIAPPSPDPIAAPDFGAPPSPDPIAAPFGTAVRIGRDRSLPSPDPIAAPDFGAPPSPDPTAAPDFAALPSPDPIAAPDFAAPPSPIKIKSLPSLMGAFKTTASKYIRRNGLPDFRWHKSYHDRIIRDDRQLERIRRYIAANPSRWLQDRF